MLLLQGMVRGDWYGAVLRVRAAVNECGFVLEEHPFSGIMMNFRLELLRERVAAQAGQSPQTSHAVKSARAAARSSVSSPCSKAS